MSPQKINNSKDIQQAIQALEQEIKVQEATIKLEASELKTELAPQKLMRNTFSKLSETPEIQKVLINTAIGFVLGFASKKTMELLSEESLNRTTENFVKHHITKLEQKEPNSLLSKGISLVRKFTPPSSRLYPFVKY